MTKEEVKDWLFRLRADLNNGVIHTPWNKEFTEALNEVLEQEPKTDYKAFAEWVAKEIFSEEWELNKDSFAEIACRKLEKLGLVKAGCENWVLPKYCDRNICVRNEYNGISCNECEVTKMESEENFENISSFTK